MELGVLQIFEGVSAGRQDVPLDIHPKGKDKVNYQRGTHCKKRNVDKPGPDTGSGDTHPFTNCRTHSKHLPLDEVLESIHGTNLKKINCP
ncbi:MAG TPA: hypothetical protein VI233_17910 [Puia sp.]